MPATKPRKTRPAKKAKGMNCPINHVGFVITDTGRILVHVPNRHNGYGFILTNAEEHWHGGIGSGAKFWEAITDDDARISEHEHDLWDWFVGEEREYYSGWKHLPPFATPPATR